MDVVNKELLTGIFFAQFHEMSVTRRREIGRSVVRVTEQHIRIPGSGLLKLVSLPKNQRRVSRGNGDHVNIIFIGEQPLHIGKYRIGTALLQAEYIGIVVRLTDEIVHRLHSAFPRGFRFRRQHVVTGQRYTESSGTGFYRTNPSSGTILSYASHAH